MQGQVDGQSKESTTERANAVVIDGSVRRGSIAAISPGTAETKDPSRSCPSSWATASLRSLAHNVEKGGQCPQDSVTFQVHSACMLVVETVGYLLSRLVGS